MTTTPAHVAAQNITPSQMVNAPDYVAIADFALASKVTAHVRVKSAQKLKGDLAVGTAQGFARHLVTADVISLIKAPSGMPPQLRYIIDLPLDSRGKLPRVKKSESLIFALPARDGEVRLVAPNAAILWSPAAGQTVRAILSESTGPDAPPLVRGIASGFHSRGSLPGEGETQIFLDAADNRPASLTIRRSANAAPSWFVSLGEVVDEGTSQPARNTLLWYRLACFLPAKMPASVTAGQDATDALQVAEDYAYVLTQLGPCQRAQADKR